LVAGQDDRRIVIGHYFALDSRHEIGYSLAAPQGVIGKRSLKTEQLAIGRTNPKTLNHKGDEWQAEPYANHVPICVKPTPIWDALGRPRLNPLES
jgi:hypothetical protein